MSRMSRKKRRKNCEVRTMKPPPREQEAAARQVLYDSQARKELLAKALVGEGKTSERWGWTCAFLLLYGVAGDGSLKVRFGRGRCSEIVELGA